MSISLDDRFARPVQIANATDGVAEAIGTLVKRHGPAAPLWSHVPTAPEWREAGRLYGMSREQITAEWGDVDMALREAAACRNCQMGVRLANGEVGECNLARDMWVGEPLHPGGSRMWYLVRVGLPYAEDEERRFEWRKRRCGGPEKRALELAGTRTVEVGGMRAVVVDGGGPEDDEGIPFAEGDR